MSQFPVLIPTFAPLVLYDGVPVLFNVLPTAKFVIVKLLEPLPVAVPMLFDVKAQLQL